MPKLEIRSQPGTQSFNGFEESFPRELTNIVPVKEYITAIEILNNNGIRNHISYIWAVMGYAFFGLLPIIIVGIVEIFRWASFKKKLCKDLNKCIENINGVLVNRQVSFSFKMDYNANVVLTIKYPEVQTSVPNQTVQLEGGQGNAILVQPFTESITIVDPKVNKQETQPIDSNYKTIVIAQNPIIFKKAGFQGFTKNYSNKLYNYISYEEYNAMMDDINKVCVKPFNQTAYKFFLISALLTIALIGIILIFPAMFWYLAEVQKHARQLYNDIEEVTKKYSAIFNQRGVTVSYHSANKTGILVSLTITIPSDVGQAPLLTHFTSGELLLAPTIPGGVLPYYRANGLSAIISPEPVQIQTFGV